MRLSVLLRLALLAETAYGLFPRLPKIQTIEDSSISCDGSQPDVGTGHFEQLLNHSNPAQGTFKQKYFWSNTHWGGPGYPVIIMTPGEQELAPFCGFFSIQALPSQFAAAVRGAVVYIEHRYWGDSSPYQVLNTDTLQHLTLNNSVADLVYFARNVQLPFDKNGSSNAPHAPWIMTGGSYAGALTAWTAKLSPGTYWAYHATSAPVQAIYDFWQYFSPIKDGMASNCSQDVEAITAYIDDFVNKRSDADIQTFKEEWGLATIPNKADFSSALSNAVDTWQDSSLTSGYSKFFKMCDAVEGYGVPKRETETRDNTTDIETKVSNVAWWFKNKFILGWCWDKFPYPEYKDPKAVGCLNSYNLSSPLYTDRAVNNSADIQWSWLLCNEPFAYWQTGSVPDNKPTLASRLMDAAYFQRQCDILFGKNSTSNKTPSKAPVTTAYGSELGITVDDVNRRTDGWNFTSKRLLWVNGEFDPWRPASVSSTDRPGGMLASTPDSPVIIIKGGKHCEDLSVRSLSYLQGVQVQEVNYIVQWVNDFYDNATAQGQQRTVPKLQPITHLRGFL